MFNGYNKDQIEIIKEGVPDKLIKYRDKGGRRYSYVELPTVTEILNKLFGNLWSWNILENNIHDTGIADQKNGITKRYVQIKGRLTVPMQDPNDPKKFIWIEREANGVHALLGGDMEIRAAAFKSASSDALKKAASSLGVARNVYMSDELLMHLESLEADEELDVWTEETIAEMKDEYDAMIAFAKEHSDLNYYKKTFCDETQNYTEYMQITPSNIKAFLSWAKEFDKRFTDPKPVIQAVPQGAAEPW